MFRFGWVGPFHVGPLVEGHWALRSLRNGALLPDEFLIYDGSN